MASSQQCSMIRRRISLSLESALPGNSGEPLKTMVMRDPDLSQFSGSQGCILLNM